MGKVAASTLAVLSALVAAISCTSFGAADDVGSDGGSADGPVSSLQEGGDEVVPVPVRCAGISTFRVPSPLDLPIPPMDRVYAGWMSGDGQLLYVGSNMVHSGGGSTVLFQLTGSGLGKTWALPIFVTALGSGAMDDADNPSFTRDRRTIAFTSHRPTTLGGANLWIARRTDAREIFEPPTLLSDVSSEKDDHEPWLTPSGDRVYFASSRSSSGKDSLFYSDRTVTGSYDVAVQMKELDDPGADGTEAPVLAGDELTMFFSSNRSSTRLKDVFVATRTSRLDLFSAPRLVPELSTAVDDSPTWISEDGCDIILATFDPPAKVAKLSWASRR